MATTIKTEQRILTLETISGAVKLNSEVVLSLSSGNIVNYPPIAFGVGV